MNKLANILQVFGGLLLVYSAVVTFKLDIAPEIEDIIYFRGILLGAVMLLLGSAINSNKIITQNILLSLGFGNFMVLIASTYNLVFDADINLDIYFDIAIYATFVGMALIIIIRVWNKRRFLKKH